MQKVWTVWQTVDFDTDWVVGTYATQAKADAARDAFFVDWCADRDTTVAQYVKQKQQDDQWWSTAADCPFFVTSDGVQ